MLVLARQRDETIIIGDDIEVTVVDIRGDKVRLGINAPRSVSVHRKEVYDAIRRDARDGVEVKQHDLSLVVFSGDGIIGTTPVISNVPTLTDPEIGGLLDRYATTLKISRKELRGVCCPMVNLIA